ncbi:FadR/GntR family transcriptional regulator [Humibacter ginsenosidimutans]|uniref:FadR family transcriptional regulator n=1 Tax=Humibacter ginsenosidimutans TaxID=2599293 RepID=A0A5B8M9H9_9MICO|nr:FadR/GntR family transcriptional regulator [Humibacter ginsenosidimutans]QDZ16325.1 FadR family transcriptional regulator [Humibacter ginsenosidimutans]
MAVTDEAILKIKEMITSGRLSPGDRLPPEKELSETLGLSRSSLREAVKALEVIRVLDVRRGDGTYVTSLEPRLLLEALSFVVDLHDDRSVLEIFGVRRILEPSATRLAAGRISDEQLDALSALVDQADAAADIEALVQHDLEFHRAIVASCGNDYLAQLIDSISSNTVRARIWRGLTQQGATDRTVAEHRAILGALREHDAELASAHALTHIAGIEDWLREAVGATG